MLMTRILISRYKKITKVGLKKCILQLVTALKHEIRGGEKPNMTLTIEDFLSLLMVQTKTTTKRGKEQKN